MLKVRVLLTEVSVLVLLDPILNLLSWQLENLLWADQKRLLAEISYLRSLTFFNSWWTLGFEPKRKNLLGLGRDTSIAIGIGLNFSFGVKNVLCCLGVYDLLKE